MNDIPFFQVDAFADRPFAGNPAAVMPLERWLDDAVLQAIAAENNLSETAFVVPGEAMGADFHLRWFTPTTEVDLCGHATLAAAHILLDGPEISFQTRSGQLRVQRRDGLYWLDLPAFGVDPGEEPGLMGGLGLDAAPTFLGRGGNGAAIVLLEDAAAVAAVSPDFHRLRTIDRLVMVTAPGGETDVVSRVFAAYHGIDEDPVTGSAHAALVPFWAKRLGRTRFSAFQASKRGGRLECELRGDRVLLGGHAVTTVEGRFRL